MHIEVNTIDIGILQGQFSYKSIIFTTLFVIFIIPREICNMDMQYKIWKFFHMCVLFFKFPINDPI